MSKRLISKGFTADSGLSSLNFSTEKFSSSSSIYLDSCWAVMNKYQLTAHHPPWGLCGGSCDSSWWEMRWDLNDPCGHTELLQQLHNRTEWDRDWGSYLRVEVSVVNVLVVQVDHSSAYITGQVHLLSPAQGNIFPGQKLLQTATIYILKQPTYTRIYRVSKWKNKRN